LVTLFGFGFGFVVPLKELHRGGTVESLVGTDDVIGVLPGQQLMIDLPEGPTLQLRRVRFLAPERLFAYLGALAPKDEGRREVHDTEQILTAREVEKLLKIDVKTIYGNAQRGLLPHIRIQSNLRFLKSEVLKWMDEHRFRPKPRREWK
jgi:predicted DNA-binding transcriptional regulator AlpA